jgi:hypothetical protein
LTSSEFLKYRAAMTRKSQLNTVEEVIEAFGGSKAMCALFGGGLSRFSNYKAAGKFPDSMHMRIYVAARERGLNIAPELIGMVSEKRQRELPLRATG